MLHLHT